MKSLQKKGLNQIKFLRLSLLRFFWLFYNPYVYIISSVVSYIITPIVVKSIGL